MQWYPKKKVVQISESHCAPAVLEMLLSAIGVEVDQQEIVIAAGAEKTLPIHGLRIDQLALAASRVAPHSQFWYKYYSSLDDIKYILDKGYGVGIEWQGLFYENEKEEKRAIERGHTSGDDFGHYSIVSHIDEAKQMLIIIDPYKDFADQDRIFSVSSFLNRWWDTNEIFDPVQGRKRIVEDERLLFFVTPIEEELPGEMGFKKFASVETDE